MKVPGLLGGLRLWLIYKKGLKDWYSQNEVKQTERRSIRSGWVGVQYNIHTGRSGNATFVGVTSYSINEHGG
jgi:hypothetical protein